MLWLNNELPISKSKLTTMSGKANDGSGSLEDWVWVSKDDLFFYEVESTFFPSSNERYALPIGTESYSDWRLLNKMHQAACQLDQLITETEDSDNKL